MSGESKSASISGNSGLGDSGKGLSISGNADNTIAAKSGSKVDDDIVAATINLGNLDKNDVQNISETLKPYENNMKVSTKKDSSAGIALDSLGSGLKTTPQGLPKKFPSSDASTDSPGVSFNGFNGDLNADHGSDGEITGPTLNGDLPKFNLKKPSGDAGARVTMPSVGLPESHIKADLDGSLKAPDVSASGPQVKMPSSKIDKPDLRTGKYQAPKFQMPSFNIPHVEPPETEMGISGDMDLPSVSGVVDAPNLNLSAPKMSLQNPDLDSNGPKGDLNGPDLKLTPNADIEAPSGKLKWPHLKWKSAKVRGPDADLDAEMMVPDVKLPTANVGGDLSGPDVDVDLPTADIKAPEVDVKTPDLDLDPPSGKINWPHLKWKKPKLHGSRDSSDIDANIDTPDVDLTVPKVKGGLDTPEVDLNLPKADIKGPDLDVQSPNIDLEAPSGKISWPHLKWKKPKIQGPKADFGIDGDLNTPDVDLTSPKIEGDSNVPKVDVNLPKADLTAPDTHFQAPDLDPPTGKINWPHSKWKKPKLNGPKAEVDASLNAPDVNLSAPKIDGQINSPDIDLNLPKADVNIEKPDLDVDSPSGKIKWPTFKKPKWSVGQPKVNGPDVDLDANVSAPDLNLSAPKIDGQINSPDIDLNLPKADVDIEKPDLHVDSPSGKLKLPTFKKPKWSVGQPKVNGPDVDANVSAPDLNLSAPKIDSGIHTDVNLKAPKAEVDGSSLDVNPPDVDLDNPSGKFNLFPFKKNKTGTSKTPNAELETDVKVPNLDFDKSLSDLDAKVPKADLTAPNVNLEGPTLRLPAPKIENGLNSPDTDFDSSVPKSDLTSRNHSKGIGSDLQNANLNLSSPKINGSLSAPNTDAKLPKADSEGSATMKSPNSDIASPKAEFKAPDGQLKTPDLDLDPHLGDFKMPHFKVPALDLSSPKAEIPHLHGTGKAALEPPKVDSGSSTANPSISIPTVESNGPKVEGPKVDVKTPEIDASVEKAKFPHIKLPKFSFSGSKSKSGEVDASAITDDDASDVETNAPVFKFHKSPKQTVDVLSDISDASSLSKRDSGEKDFIVSKGVRLPISNASKATGKVDIMERLKLSKEKTASVFQTDEKNDADSKLAAPTLAVGASAEATDSSVVRGSTFKIEKSESVQGSADESQKSAQGLAKMLCLDTEDSDDV